MEFHRDWHAHLDGRGRQLGQMRLSRTLDQWTSGCGDLAQVAYVEASPEFVSRLRGQLMAEALLTWSTDRTARANR